MPVAHDIDGSESAKLGRGEDRDLGDVRPDEGAVDLQQSVVVVVGGAVVVGVVDDLYDVIDGSGDRVVATGHHLQVGHL